MNGMVNIDGKIVKADDAKVSIFDHGFLYGDSVYETIRTYHKKPFLLSQHIRRLFQSAKAVQIQSAWDQPHWVNEINRTIDVCKVDGELCVRLVLSRGVGELGLDPALCPRPTSIVIVKSFPSIPAKLYEVGVSVRLVSIVRNDIAALPPSVKTGNFLNNILAFIEAKSNGDYDGIMCNIRGELTEGTTSNFFLVKNGVVLTTPDESGILPGITRSLVEEICRELKISFEKIKLLPSDIKNSNEAFLTSTIKEVVPVTKCNGENIGDGRVGRITKRIQEAFSKKAEELTQTS